jgi:hypothetical protein
MRRRTGRHATGSTRGGRKWGESKSPCGAPVRRGAYAIGAAKRLRASREPHTQCRASRAATTRMTSPTL